MRPQTPLFRWTIGAREVVFKRPAHSLFFRLGKTLPIVRGKGIYQPTMNQIIEELDKGDWLHVYPEGKINLTKEFTRLKWGVARLIAETRVPPIVLPCYHFGI
jgi:monolysocardiolipin acyltransferase